MSTHPAGADRFLRTQRAMFEAPAHALVERFADALRAGYGTTGVHVLLADYDLVALCPVTPVGPAGPAAVPITGTADGDAFVNRRVLVTATAGGVRVTLPVAVRGDALGVLCADFAAEPDAATVAELRSLADGLARDLRAADAVTDRYRAVRRRARLTVAAELQWRLLPGRSGAGPGFAIAGQLEPAHAVCGDNFDWAAEADHLTVTVTNGHRDGIGAALLTALGVTALRNARLAGGGLADQAALADQAVYAQYAGRRHLSTLMLRVDLATGGVVTVDAGSPMMLRLRDGRVHRLDLDAQLPLGMFESTVYVEQEFRLEPGDRLVVLSDGVHDALYGDNRYSGHGRLRRTIVGTRWMPPVDAVRAVLADHSVFRRGAALTDDAAVVCLDWSGPPARPVA